MYVILYCFDLSFCFYSRTAALNDDVICVALIQIVRFYGLQFKNFKTPDLGETHKMSKFYFFLLPETHRKGD